MNTIAFTREALLHLKEWRVSDPKTLPRIILLITEIASEPFTGIGKPEPLNTI